MDFSEARRKKVRGMSNEEFVHSYLDEWLTSESMVIVSIGKDQIVKTYQTSDSQLTTIGLLELAKQQIMDSMESSRR